MKIVKRQMMLHHAVSMIGGFMGGYTILNFSDIFPNSLTLTAFAPGPCATPTVRLISVVSTNKSDIVFLIHIFLFIAFLLSFSPEKTVFSSIPV